MKYRFSVAAFELAPVAMQEVAVSWLDCGSGEATYERVVKENALKCRTISVLWRMAAEIVLRNGKPALQGERV